MLRYLLLICLLLNSLCTTAQDPHFTQFRNTPLYLNPAIAGNLDNHRISLQSRYQWPKLSGSFVTNAVSYDFEVKNNGIGFLAVFNNAGRGTIHTSNISLIYSRIFRKDDWKVALAIQPTYFRKTLDWSKLTFGDMIDPRYGFIYETEESPGVNMIQGFDMSTGVNAQYKSFGMGIAVHHLLEPSETFIEGGAGNLPQKYSIYAQRMMNLECDGWRFMPGLLFTQQQDFRMLVIDMAVQYKHFVASVMYRNQDAFILMFSYRSSRFNIGYSYDTTISKLSDATAGTHEIMLGWNIKRKKKENKTES